MLESLRAELRAIREWPLSIPRTETERDAVTIRALRAMEIAFKIKELVAKN
jgi:hypothetical protein